MFVYIFPGVAHLYAEENNLKTNAKPLDELLYKNTLYHYYSGDYIAALTKTLINEKRQNINNDARSKLLQGGIYLAYGLDYDAKNIFEYMNNESINEDIRNVIWYYLGRDFYNNFDYANTADSLEKITRDSSYKNKQERINILSNVYVYTNNIEKIKILLTEENVSKEDKLYLKFNLAIAYFKNNDRVKSKQLLRDIANLKPSNIEQATISDKAKLHLANLSFKEKDYKDTIKYIESMDANGLYSDSAIYLSALSHSIIGNTQKSFTLLNNLKQRESKNIYKYYSILLIARILEKNGSLPEALQVLNTGLSGIVTEKSELDGLLNKIRKNFFLADLAKTSDGEIVIANASYKKLVDDLIFNRNFSTLYNNYIDLVLLKNTIRHWQNQLPQLTIMLTERDKYFKEKKSKVSMQQFHSKKHQYMDNLNSLANSFKAIQRQPDVEALFTDAESEYADDLDYMEQKVNKLSKQEDMSDFEEKIRIMKGVNYWNAASQYRPRLWQTKSELKETRIAFSTLEKQIESLQQTSKSEFNYSRYKTDITAMTKRLDGLSILLAAITTRLKEQLILIAAEELDRRFKGIDAYYKAFKFDVARVSDRILLDKKE
jgi:hypothetical protein